MEVAPGIHRIEAPLGERFVCMYLLVGERATLLLDTGLAGMPGEHLTPYLASIGRSWDDVHFVLTSHIDFDHTGGNAEVRAHTPRAVFACHEADRPMIEDVETMIAGRYACYAADHGIDEPEETKKIIRDNAHHVPIDLALVGGERLRLSDDWTVEVWHTPGHSLGHISLWDPRSRSLVIADAALGEAVLTKDGQPAFPPTYCHPAEYRASIRSLQHARADRILTSHYPVYEGSAADGFLALSLAYTDRVEHCLARVIKDAPQPLTLKQIIDTTWRDLGDWPDGGYLSWPMAGHLRLLENTGRVRAERTEGVLAYEWIGERS